MTTSHVYPEAWNGNYAGIGSNPAMTNLVSMLAVNNQRMLYMQTWNAYIENIMPQCMNVSLFHLWSAVKSWNES